MTRGKSAPKAGRSAVRGGGAVEARPKIAKPRAAGASRLPEPGAAAAPPISIEIDPDVFGGFVHDRFDVQIRGRVASSATIDEVCLEADGEVVARAVFGRPDRGSQMTMPDGTPGREHAFQFTLARQGALAGTPCATLLRARSAEGYSHAEVLDLAIDPTEARPIMVRSGPLRAGIANAGGRPHMILYVERAVLDGAGNLAVHGWAVAMTAVVAVQVIVGDREPLPVTQLGGQRDDVGEAYSAYADAGSSGFVFRGQVDQSVAALGSVRVRAIGAHGFAIETVVPVDRIASRLAAPPPALPGKPQPDASRSPAPAPYLLPLPRSRSVQALAGGPAMTDAGATAGGPPSSMRSPRQPDGKRRQIHYFCDAAFIALDGTVGVDGWAVCADGIASVTIYLGAEPLGDAKLGLPRPDVGSLHPTIPMAGLAGFQFRKHVSDLADGEHLLRIVVRSGRDDSQDEIHIVSLDRSGGSVADVEEPAVSPAEAAARSEFRFGLDTPQVINDAVQQPITSRLTIEGWALARSGVTRVEVLVDDQRLGDAHYGLVRQDVGTAFPNWENALRSGFAFHCPPRSLRDGRHTVRLVAHSLSGQEIARSFAIDVNKTEGDDSITSIRRRMSKVEADVVAAVLDDLDYHPRFRLILRQTGVPEPERLRRSIESVTRQVCADWRLAVLTDTDDDLAGLHDLVAGLAGDHAERITVIGPSNAAFDAMLAGDVGAADVGGVDSDGAAELFGLLCPGDELAVDACAEIAVAGGLHRAADFLYADEACVSRASHEREPFFKPDFSPDLLLSTNYIGRPWFASAMLLRRVAVTPRGLLRDGEYDLILRCTEHAAAVHHVPRLLASRGAVVLDDDATGRAALVRAASRRGIDGDVMDGCLPGTWRLRRRLQATGKVAIVIPTCAARGLIENCIATLRDRTAYRNYEIVCIDNIPASQMEWKVWLHESADRVVHSPEPFNWSRFNNLAAAETDSDYLLFLNDDVEITQADWLDAMLEHAQQPDVGVVGPQLLYPSGTVQHAGMFLGAGIGRHAFRFAAADEPGYFGLALTQRNVIAVTGACMLMRRNLFDELGGFDEAHAVINNDLDFCLRAHLAGKRTVFTPYASLIHHEFASRDRLPDVFDTSQFNARWKTLFAAGDPYFSPLLSRYTDDYRVDEEPMQTVYAAHPLFAADEIRRILVVKLDHIGDFVTCQPAIRRLKRLFPQASITVLAGRHARSFASLEPAIDELLEFDFYHARSQLGEKQVTREDYLQLRARLAPYRFDLAVDLRKHLSTRDVLQYTGARFLAGYDYMGQFPFLDIALEWHGDKSLQRKRSHIVDDLLALVEAIATACGTDRDLLPVVPARPDPAMLPAAVRALFDRPVVAMHTGAGNITKTWPADHFSALIDLLIERNGVNVMLIGGTEEREASDALRKTLLRPDAVGSVVGETSLDALPGLLSACCLYIGNDSGPKHIAAALGIPTMGIHSGVVDAIEWAPVGRRAVALRRNMTCSPCYLQSAEDCPRALACLRHLEPSEVHRTATMMLARPMAWAANDASSATNQGGTQDSAGRGGGTGAGGTARRAACRPAKKPKPPSGRRQVKA